MNNKEALPKYELLFLLFSAQLGPDWLWTWCPDHVCPRRAAFQYGIKMSEGRKTRRFKETNEKAELDRQWKKISAVGFRSNASRQPVKKTRFPGH